MIDASYKMMHQNYVNIAVQHSYVSRINQYLMKLYNNIEK